MYSGDAAMMRGLKEYLEATCRMLLGSDGDIRGALSLEISTRLVSHHLDEATLSGCLPDRVAAYDTTFDFGEIKP